MWPRSALLLRGEYARLGPQPQAEITVQPHSVLFNQDHDALAWLQWRLWLRPQHGIHSGAAFCIELTFPVDYDAAPPDLVFMTVPFHPNISADTGRLPPRVLQLQPWQPGRPLVSLLQRLQYILDNPCLDHAEDHELNSPDAVVVANAAAADAYRRHCEQGDQIYSLVAQQCALASNRVWNGMPPSEDYDEVADGFARAAAALPRDETWNEARQLYQRALQRRAELAKPARVDYAAYQLAWISLGTARNLHGGAASAPSAPTNHDRVAKKEVRERGKSSSRSREDKRNATIEARRRSWLPASVSPAEKSADHSPTAVPPLARLKTPDVPRRTLDESQVPATAQPMTAVESPSSGDSPEDNDEEGSGLMNWLATLDPETIVDDS